MSSAFLVTITWKTKLFTESGERIENNEGNKIYLRTNGRIGKCY